MNTIDYDASYLDAVKKGYWNNLNERYSVSKFGTVYDKIRDKIVKPCLSNRGYEVISVKYEGKWIVKGVHQLVWEAFNGKIPEGMEINHISECKTDNRLDNLNLLTHKANMRWGTRSERVSKSNTNNPKRCKSVIQKTLKGEVIRIWVSTREIERQLGYAHQNISSCCKGERKTHKGFIWQYVER